MSAREPNARSEYGEISAKTLGAKEDPPDLLGVLVHKATDGDLVVALAMRGYDVTAKVPSPGAIGARAKRFEKFKRAREAERGATALAIELPTGDGLNCTAPGCLAGIFGFDDLPPSEIRKVFPDWTYRKGHGWRCGEHPRRATGGGR